MPINMNDPRIKAEWTPQTITAVGQALRQRYGTAADSVGTRGNNVHSSGFHRSEAWLRNSPDSRYRDQDYSLQGTLNHSADANAVSALDFTPGSTSRMIELTNRVHRAALARDPRLRNVFEFAGTLNGTSVVTFRCSDGAARGPFDSSHLWHFHASFYRSRALDPHDGFTAVLLGEEPQPMATLQDDSGNGQWLIWRLDAMGEMSPVYRGGSPDQKGKPVPFVQAINEIRSEIAALSAKVSALSAPSAGAPFTEDQLAQIRGVIEASEDS
jgi:hypothetical protein